MNVGLPGTGIGGLFYLLSVFLICITEFISLLKGRRSKKRWMVVFEQLIMTIAMVITAIITNIFFSTFVFKKRPVPLPTQPTSLDIVVNTFQNHPILIPFILLFLVLSFINMMYLMLLGYKAISKNKGLRKLTPH